MFRKLCISCLFIFSFQFLHAQNFQAGVIGGVSTTQVAGDQLSGFNKAGIIAGAFVNRSLSEKAAIQMEIIFIQKGSRKPLQPDIGNQYYVMRVSYIEVPVLLKWQVSQKLGFELGPSVGVLIFSEEEDETGIRKNMPPFNKYDYSGNVGFSYLLTEKLNINTRFITSIIPMRDYPGGFSFAYFDRGQYNTVLAFTLHYQF